MRGTLLIARLTWLETRRRRIALAALICGLLFLAVFATAMYFGFRLARAGGPGGGPVNVVEMRIAATILTVAGLYVVNFLVTAVAILLPIDSLSGEISSGVIQTLASKPVDRAAIVVGKWLAYFAMTAALVGCRRWPAWRPAGGGLEARSTAAPWRSREDTEAVTRSCAPGSGAATAGWRCERASGFAYRKRFDSGRRSPAGESLWGVWMVTAGCDAGSEK